MADDFKRLGADRPPAFAWMSQDRIGHKTGCPGLPGVWLTAGRGQINVPQAVGTMPCVPATWYSLMPAALAVSATRAGTNM